jgi:HK97 family phage major capsid protein
MSKILELKQDRAKKAQVLKDLVEKQTTEKRSATPDEKTTWDAVFTEIRTVGEQIDSLEKLDAIDRMIAEKRDVTHQQGGGSADLQTVAFRSWMRHGENLTPEERTALNEMRSKDRTAFAGVENRTGNPQSELTGNLGGYTVPQGFYAKVIEALKYYSGIMDAGPFLLDTTMGNDVPVPTSDDTAQMGARFAENTQITTQEITFGFVTMKAWKYSSKIVLVPIELLQDSGVDIEAFIVKQMGIRLGRILNKEFTTYNGSSGPRGVLIDTPTGVTGSTGTSWSGGGASGASGGIKYNDLVNLKYSVNRLYRQGAKFMMHDDTLAAILQLVDSNGRPLILDYLTTLQQNEPEVLLGQPMIVNNDMPTLGSAGSPLVGNQAVIYGDFSNYWVRRVMAMTVQRLVERYADIAQVGFLALLRQDGRMVDAGQNPIKAFVSATS